MSEQPVRKQGEKDEKAEKEEEKDEKNRQEKNWDEKWRRDPLNAAVWALILIWAGMVLLASSIGFLKWLPIEDAWPLFFLGAGFLLLAEAAVRVLVPAYSAPVRGTIVLGIIFLAIALGGLVNWALIWAFVLIGIGVSLLLGGLLGRRK